MLPDGTRNGIRCTRLEHKLGIHSSPTCVMELDGAIGDSAYTFGVGEIDKAAKGNKPIKSSSKLCKD